MNAPLKKLSELTGLAFDGVRTVHHQTPDSGFLAEAGFFRR